MSLTESSSNCAFGKRAKARYSSVSASSAPTCSRIAPTSAIASLLLRASRCSCTMSPSSSAFSPMAAMGLRTSCATLSDRRPTVAMRSASTSFSWAACSRVSVPDTSTLSRSTSLRARRSRPATRPEGVRGQAHQQHQHDHRGPARPRLGERRRGGVEQPGDQRQQQTAPRTEVERVDGDEREEQQVEEAVGAAGQIEQEEDEQEVDAQRADEDRSRRARLDGDEREDAGLVRGEPHDDATTMFTLTAGLERVEAERRRGRRP